MFLVDQLILLAGVLLLIGIASSKFSVRIGMPVLVLFIFVGMLAGEEGIGRIEFDDFTTAHAIGTVALAVILFDGGMRTETAALRIAWKPSFLLATVRVLVTAVMGLGDAVSREAKALELFVGPDAGPEIQCPACNDRFEPASPYRGVPRGSQSETRR